MEPTNRDASMTICRWSRKNNDGDVAMHVWSYSPDTRWTHDDNKQTTWRRMICKWTTKIETQEEAPKGNLSKWREWLHKRSNKWNTEQRSRHFSGLAIFGGTRENDHLFESFNLAGGLRAIETDHKFLQVDPQSTTDFAYTETYKGHWRTVTWHQDPTDA